MRMGTKLAYLTLACALVGNTARAAGVDPTAATPVQREQAQTRFKAGQELLKQNKYKEALVELRGSIDIVQSPNSRLLIARCLMKLGRLVEAYAEFGRTIVEGKEMAREDQRYDKVADSASDERDEVEKLIGLVTVTVTHATDATTLRVGDEDTRRGAWGEPTPVMPGTSQIVVQTPGRKAVTQSITLSAGGKQTIALDAGTDPIGTTTNATAPSDATTTHADSGFDKTKLRPYAYAAGAVGVIGMAVFVIEGLGANSTYSSLQAACNNGPCPASKADDISSGKSQQTLANVGLAVGLVGLAAGGVLFVLSLPKKDSAPPQASLVVSPMWIGVRGTL